MKRFATLTSLIVLLLGLPTHATTLAGLNQAELIQRADIIVHATPVQQISRWQGSRIVTTYTLSVSDYLAGTGPKELHVQLLGGQVEGLAQHVSGVPVLQLEQPKILFLRQNPKGLSFSPIQLGLGVFSFDAAKKTWGPELGEVHILGPVPHSASFDELKVRIKALRARK